MNSVPPRRPKTDGITLKNKYAAVAATRLRWFIQNTPPEKSLNNLT